MAGQLTRRAAAAALNYITGTALDLGAAPQTMYATLLTAPPPDNPNVGDLNELVGTGYQRQAVTWEKASGTPADIVNLAAILFGPFLDPGGMGYPATHIALIGVGVPESTANLLPTNVAEITTDATGWTAGTNCSIARSTAQFKVTPASLAVTVTATGDSDTTSAARYSVVGAHTYKGGLWVRSATAGLKTTCDLLWYDNNDILLATSTGTQATLVANTWTEVTRTAAAPAAAVKVALKLRNQATGAAQIAFCDSMSVVPTVTSDVLMSWQLDAVGQAAQGESLQFQYGSLGMSLS